MADTRNERLSAVYHHRYARQGVHPRRQSPNGTLFQRNPLERDLRCIT